MTIIARIDPTTSPRRIYLHSDTVGVAFQPMDAYKEMRALRASNESLRPFDVFMTAQGNEPTGPSSATPRRVRMENSVFVPANTDHTLTVVGEVITSSGGSGFAAFDRTPLDPSTTVDINYIPPQVEILYITTGGGGGASPVAIAAQVRTELAAELLRIIELAKVHGLVNGTSLVVTPTSRSAGTVQQTITESGGTVTVSRRL